METDKTRLIKGKQGYGYKYTDLAQIHTYLEENDMSYYQYIDRADNDDYIITVPIIKGEEKAPRRGVKLVTATLNGISNLAQEQGSAITYARRYSLLMAFGLATEDDDAACLTTKKNNKEDFLNQMDQDGEMINEKQKQMIKMSISETSLKAILEKAGVETIDDLTYKQAYELQKTIDKKKGVANE